LAAACATLWLAALWYAAALLPFESNAGRIRNALFLGTGLAFGLGFAGLLQPLLLTLALTILVAVRFAKGSRGASKAEPPSLVAIPLGAVSLVAWPALVRPPLEGDTLLYHLPNAVAWAHAHSVWVTTTHYWAYPGSSELFAAAYDALAGPFGIGVCGALALWLLGARIATWCWRLGWRPQAAALFASAAVAAPAFALQAGSLENDVWLGAFFLETLWCMRFERSATLLAASVCGLTKATGSLYTAIAFVSGPSLGGLLGFVPVCLWLARDALLWPHALLPSGNVVQDAGFATSIAGHGLAGMTLLASVALHNGPTLPLLAMGVVGLRYDKRLAIAALAAGALFLVTPFGFATDVPQLVNGHSLRYAAPFLACGAIGLAAAIPQRYRTPAALLASLVLACEVLYVWSIFWNDAHTSSVLFVAVLTLCMLSVARWRPLFLRAAPLLLFLAATVASSNPVPYYDDWAVRDETSSPKLFEWLSRHCPPRLVVHDLRAGAVNVLCPDTLTIDAVDGRTCEQARAEKAWLLDGSDALADSQRFADHRRETVHCGDDLFSQVDALVVRGGL
jgi:hypothetical protein